MEINKQKPTRDLKGSRLKGHLQTLNSSCICLFFFSMTLQVKMMFSCFQWNNMISPLPLKCKTLFKHTKHFIIIQPTPVRIVRMRGTEARLLGGDKQREVIIQFSCPLMVFPPLSLKNRKDFVSKPQHGSKQNQQIRFLFPSHKSKLVIVVLQHK